MKLFLDTDILVDMAIDQLLVSTDDTNPLSEQREAVLQAQL